MSREHLAGSASEPKTLRGARWAFEEIALAGGLLAAAIPFSLMALAREMRGHSLPFERGLLLFFRDPANAGEALGPVWLQKVVTELTALGGVFVLTLLTGFAMAFLSVRRLFRSALMVAFTYAGALILNFSLKELFDRARPSIVSHLDYVSTPSFPSGHALLSTAVYAALGVIVSRRFSDLPTKAFLLGSAFSLALLIGVSRVYLGVHYPSDVLGGWTIGFGWAAICTRLFKEDRPPL